MTWTALTLAGAAAMLAAFWCVVNKNIMFIACGIFSIVILGVRDSLGYKSRQRARTGQLADRAVELGFEFQETAPYNVLGWSRTFQLTRRGFAFEPVSRPVARPAAGVIAVAACVEQHSDSTNQHTLHRLQTTPSLLLRE